MGALIDRFDWQAALLISSGMTLAVAIVWADRHADDERDAEAPIGDRSSASVDLGAALACAPPAERDRHHAQLRGIWLFSIPVLLLDHVLLRDDSAPGSR